MMRGRTSFPLALRERAGVRATSSPLPPGEGQGVRAVFPNFGFSNAPLLTRLLRGYDNIQRGNRFAPQNCPPPGADRDKPLTNRMRPGGRRIKGVFQMGLAQPTGTECAPARLMPR